MNKQNLARFSLLLILIVQTSLQQIDFDGQKQEEGQKYEGPFDEPHYQDNQADNQQNQDEKTEDGEQAKQNMKIMEEWETHMSDFIPDEMLTFTIQSSDILNFFEDVTEPTNIRGAFFVSFYSQEVISFRILNHRGQAIYKRNKKKESIFSLDVTEQGTYTFEFDNSQGNDNKDITFAIDLKHRSDDHLSLSHIDPIEQQLQIVHVELSDILIETKYSNKRQESYFFYVQKTHGRLLLMSVFETIAILAATIWQTYYIKKILDNRRIV